MQYINGACHCGEVLWQATLPIKTVVQCHCSNCRRLQGSDYSNWVVLQEDQFKLITGERFIKKYQFNERSCKAFCSTCGSVVFGVNGKHFPEHRLVSLATVRDYDERLKPQLQVYTESKVAWL